MNAPAQTAQVGSGHPTSLSGSLSGAIALGIGLMLPAASHAAPLQACVLGTALTSDACGLDVNGGGYDIQMDVFGTTSSLRTLNTGTLLLLPGNFDGKVALLRLAAGSLVDASMFDGDPGVAGGFGYANFGSYQQPQWITAGTTGFAAFRMPTSIGSITVYRYGWVELTSGIGSLTINSFGYETDYNKGSILIPAGAPTNTPAQVAGGTPTDLPEPASLLLVATGVAGLAALRRRRREAAPESAH